MNERKIDVELTLHNEEKYTASDDFQDEGSIALLTFEKHKTVSLTDDGKTVYIPFHAIESQKTTMRTVSKSYTDDFCIDASSGGCAVVGKAIVGKDKVC